VTAAEPLVTWRIERIVRETQEQDALAVLE
jgi:hypothetical protein